MIRSNAIRLATILVALGTLLLTVVVSSVDKRPAVLLVNGFNDCCANRLGEVIKSLEKRDAEFIALTARGDQSGNKAIPWNSLYCEDQGFQAEETLFAAWRVSVAFIEAVMEGILEKAPEKIAGALERSPGLKTLKRFSHSRTDVRFQEEVSAYVNALPAHRPLILIGHSFGADSLVRTLSRIDRPIQFLGLLDPVGEFGLRFDTVDNPIPAQVRYLYNRWQSLEVPPFDYLVSSGEFAACYADVCDQAPFSGQDDWEDEGWAHNELTTAPATQREMIARLDGVIDGALRFDFANLKRWIGGAFFSSDDVSEALRHDCQR